MLILLLRVRIIIISRQYKRSSCFHRGVLLWILWRERKRKNTIADRFQHHAWKYREFRYDVYERLRNIYLRIGSFHVTALALIIIPQEWSIVLWDGAFVYNSWRFFLSACSIPILIGVVCLFMFPESPKFLMSQDRMDDALKVFQRIYSINTGKPPEQYPVRISYGMIILINLTFCYRFFKKNN